MSTNDRNLYDLIINDDDDIMLLLYARDSAPSSPSFDIDIDNKKAILYRSNDEGITIDDLSDDALDILCGMDKLLVCELSLEDNDDDTEIINAYEAKINC